MDVVSTNPLTVHAISITTCRDFCLARPGEATEYGLGHEATDI